MTWNWQQRGQAKQTVAAGLPNSAHSSAAYPSHNQALAFLPSLSCYRWVHRGTQPRKAAQTPVRQGIWVPSSAVTVDT